MSHLHPSSSFRVINQTLHQTSLPSESYVLSLTSVASLYAASASSPSNQIHLFDRATLRSTGVLKGHEHATTHLRTVNPLGASTREMLLSSGKDGYVVAWDERSGSASIKSGSFISVSSETQAETSTLTTQRICLKPVETSGRTRPLLCCDASDDGSLVAAGTDLQGEGAFIIYWDPRNPVARLRSHGSTHSDDITAIHFLKSEHKSSSHKVLLSTSSDGLISTSNALEADEDDAVMHVGNWGCSVSQGGWISNAHGTSIWAASDMETFSSWSNELDQLSTMDIRRPSLHDHGHTWVTDYLITGHSTPKEESGLGVFVGSNEGDLALITSNNLSDAMTPWTIHSVWTGGHSGIVRSLFWDEKHDVLVTGGEDSKILAWRIQTPGATDFLANNQLDETLKAEESNLKREWDVVMDDEQTGTAGKRARR